MASYDLVCQNCGNAFEVFVQGFIKDEDKQCPACGSFKTQQKFTSFMSNARSLSCADGKCGVPAPSSGFG